MRRKQLLWASRLIMGLTILLLAGCRSQSDLEAQFYLGVDLSYVNEMDDCGAVYLEGGEQQEAFELFSNHGATLVRARLWHDPDWTEYSTLEDVERTFSRAQDAGMATLLAFHYSDNWADPSKQAIPTAWEDFSEDELLDALYQYTYEIMISLDEQGLMPDFVQVGNEINAGLLKAAPGLDWPRDAALINAGIRAIRDSAEETKTDVKIILHVAQPENAGWWFREAEANGVTDFDVIGLSYYPQWSEFSVADVGAHVTYLREEFDKDVMIVETAYPWTFDALDETADNILNQGIRAYSISIEGQRQFLIDLTQSLISNGALGVVYWEPAWVSTECSTRWGQGSHWENATFFDFKNGNEVHEGIDFLSYPYIYPVEQIDGIVDESYGDPLLTDDVGDNLDQVPHLDLTALYAKSETDSIYLSLSVEGDFFEDDWGSVTFYIDTTQDEQGADIDFSKHPITVSDPYKPEYLIEVTSEERKGTISTSLGLYRWDGEEWQGMTMTGGAAIKSGTPTVIELQIPKALLGDPDFINIGVVSVGRGRVHTAGDILGTSISPTDWKEPVALDIFTHIDLTARIN